MIDLVDFQPLLFLGIRVLKGRFSLYSATLPTIFTPPTQRFARNCLFCLSRRIASPRFLSSQFRQLRQAPGAPSAGG